MLFLFWLVLLLVLEGGQTVIWYECGKLDKYLPWQPSAKITGMVILMVWFTITTIGACASTVTLK